MGERPWKIEPFEWEMTYVGHVIGRIRRRRDGFHAKCLDEPIGVYPDGDSAATAVWRRYCDASTVRHEQAAVTHGAYERHVRTVDA